MEMRFDRFLFTEAEVAVNLPSVLYFVLPESG